MSSRDTDRLFVATPERLAASALFLAWVFLAFRIGGIPLAVRAVLVFMIPLVMIWLPELMSRLSIPTGHSGPAPWPAPPPLAIRLVGWLILLGVPAFWNLLFSL